MHKLSILVLLFVLVTSGDALASRIINSATVNGGSSATVTTDADVIISLDVTTSDSDNDWKGTGWRISSSDGPLNCIDDPNKNNSGNYNESITVTAPSDCN